MGCSDILPHWNIRPVVFNLRSIWWNCNYKIKSLDTFENVFSNADFSWEEVKQHKCSLDKSIDWKI
jgi:hypothetical protein